MKMGVHIHRLPGRRRVKIAGADKLAAKLFAMVNSALKVLRGAGVKVVRHLTGSYVTSLEMAGCSITVTAADDAMLALWDAPVHTAALRWGR